MQTTTYDQHTSEFQPLESLVNSVSTARLFWGLTLAVLLFFIVQVPMASSNPDVASYSAGARAEVPTIHPRHPGHGVLLWVIYKLAPFDLSRTIWPSGAISAVSGALIAGATFLIWVHLGLRKSRALVIATVVSLIPSIWYHSLIGEVYSLQLCLILLFALLFLKEHTLFAALCFFAALLVSPTSVLSFSLVLLAPHNGRTYVRAVAVGALGVGGLVIFSIFLNPGLFTILLKPELFTLVPLAANDRLIVRMFRLLLIILINISFLLPWLVKGTKSAWEAERRNIIWLAIATLPQLTYLKFSDSWFQELGSFQLPLLWSLSFPVGLAIAEESRRWPYRVAPALAGVITVTVALWLIPGQRIGMAQTQAGSWLKEQEFGEVLVAGTWRGGIQVALVNYDGDIRRAVARFVELPEPTHSDLLATGEGCVIIARERKRQLRRVFGRVPGFRLDEWDTSAAGFDHTLRKVFENEAVVLHLWERSDTKTPCQFRSLSDELAEGPRHELNQGA